MAGKWTLPSFAQTRQGVERAGANLTRTTVTPNVDANGKPEHTIDPVPETYAPRYNAYRGGEMHGVPAAEPWDGGPQGFTDGTVDVHWDHSDADEHVIPVRIVADADEVIKTWRSGQNQAPAQGNSPAPIIPRNRQRTKLYLRNISTTSQTVWISQDVNASPFAGYPLNVADGPLALETTGPVYAISSDVNPCPVAFLYEFVERVTVQ